MCVRSRFVEMDYERGYVFLSEFTAYKTVHILCPSLDFGLPHKMTVGLLILVQHLRTESHLAHPLTVAAEYDHDCTVGDGGHSGIRPEMFFDYLLDFVAYAPRFVNGGYHSTGPDLKVECSSGAVIVVVGVFGLSLEEVIAPVALMFVADIGIDLFDGLEVHHLFW